MAEGHGDYSMAESYITDSMMDVFLYESEQMLEQLENIALECEKSKEMSDANVNEIFRIMHTIKGSSGVMMFTDITTCSHTLEDVFYYIRESKPTNIPLDELVGLMLEVDDFIKGELEKIKSGQKADGSSEALVVELKEFLDRIKNNIKKSGEELPPENVYIEPEQFYIAPVMSAESKFYLITIYYRSDTEMANIRAYTAVYSLKEIAEDIKFEPEDIITDESTSDLILKNGFLIALQAQADEDEILRLIDGSGVSNIEVQRCTPDEFLRMGKPVDGSGNNAKTADTTSAKADEITIDLDAPLEEKTAKKTRKSSKKAEAAPAEEVKQSEPAEPAKERVLVSDIVGKMESGQKEQAAAPQAAPAAQSAKHAVQSFISVNVTKMDELMDLIGELVIAQAVVTQNPDLRVPGLDLTNFSKASAQLSKITSELQDVVMALRMMPLRNTFQKMNRIVYDVSRKLGKDIDLVIIGEDTEVDKNIIEHISDPIMHLVRNAVDHGIEDRSERASTSKPARGKIILEAKNEGGKVWITVKDDGKGLNRDRILEKARNNGLLNGRNEKELTDKEIYNFITLPGFSPKEQVTEYSGRGVGMDVVVQNIQQVGGSLEIDSTEGYGSTMTIKIPLTLAIIDGIIVGVGTNSYVFSTADVQEFVRIEKSQMIVEPEGSESIMLRGDCYPLIRLKQLFHLETGCDDVEDGIIAILEYEGKKTAVLVDKLDGEQEIVVKPMPSYIKKIRGISGCTQLGDGSISLILDTGSLIKE